MDETARATAGPQRRAGGPLKHLLTLAGLGRVELTALLDAAATMRAAPAEPLRQRLPGRTIAMLFFEASTRTRTSFEIAAQRLGADIVRFDDGHSSTTKGETLEDTVATLEAMGCDAFVIRHRENGLPGRLATHSRRAAIINAGDGTGAHPTQGLIDLLTIRDHRGAVDGAGVVICGDIRHSRVARSAVDGLQTLGAGSIRLCGPERLLPTAKEFPGCDVTADFDAALTGADVVMMLRLQKERMDAALIGDAAEYFRRYGLDAARLRRARPDAIVMHPGPMNRGIEIAADVADGPQSVVLEQVHNGVPVRMAVLDRLLDA